MAGYAEATRSFAGSPWDIRVVQVQAGFVGQVVTFGEIAAERGGFETGDEAYEWAQRRIGRRLRRLFA